ncbi:MAG: TIGR02186 family protein, partial [Alphaproteobacteria bacterium]
MSKWIRGICCLLGAWISTPAVATPLVADLSNYRVQVDSSFNGTRIFLFGARNDNGDIVVVVRGPSKNYMVRKKERIAGMWVNRERMKFFNVPDFYITASSRPMYEIPEYGVFEQLSIGKTHLLSPPGGQHDPSRFEEFSNAFINFQERKKLYSGQNIPISFMAETLFKTVIEFPDNIPPGKYAAEIYLLSDGNVVGMQSTPITVQKAGLDAIIYNYAHNHPALYGLTAV